MKKQPANAYAAPLAAGIGLVALDVVLSEDRPEGAPLLGGRDVWERVRHVDVQGYMLTGEVSAESNSECNTAWLSGECYAKRT